MRSLILFALLASPCLAQTVGNGVTVGTGVNFGGTVTTPPPPPTGFTFTPAAGTYTGTQNVAVAYSNPSLQLFCTTNGTAPTEASPLYAGPISVSASATIQCVATQATIIGQNVQNTKSSFGTNVASTSSQSSPYVANWNSPAIKYGPGNTSTGVSGTPTVINFLTNVSGIGDGKATHLNFTTENISGANCNAAGTSCSSQAQVLWPSIQGSANNATYQVQDIQLQPVENVADITANEIDMVQWTTTRSLILSAALQCYSSAGRWQYNGQSGSWQEFGSTTAVYKNGVVVTATHPITEDCPLPTGSLTRIAYHATFLPGYKGCVIRGSSTATECIFIDYLMIGADKYTFGTQTIGGATYSALTVDAATLGAGFPSRCFNQIQIDTAAGSVSSPVTVGEYVDHYNQTCGTGATVSGQAAYVIH